MNILVIVAIVAVVVFLIIKSRFNIKAFSDDTIRPSIDTKPTVETENDKLIVVSNVNMDDMKTVLTKFCDSYNKDKYAVLPRITQLSANEFAVTFPYDIDFVLFCFAINFLDYPTDLKWDGEVTGWATTKASDEWISSQNTGKVMLFIADNDKEYDNVSLTTSDNMGYLMKFTGKQKQLPSPSRQYKKPGVDLSAIKDKPFVDIS